MALACRIASWFLRVQSSLGEAHLCVTCGQVGMAQGPGEHEHQLVAASASGELKYMDFRLTEGSGQLSGQLSGQSSGDSQPLFSSSGASGSSAARMGIWKRVQLEDHVPISTFAAHPYAPLLSTFSPQSQVWRFLCW